jgi:hypothetical protein
MECARSGDRSLRGRAVRIFSRRIQAWILEWNRKVQLDSFALGPLLRRCLVQPLLCKPTLSALLANLDSHGEYSAAVSVQEFAAVQFVVVRLFEPIADDAELEPEQRGERSKANRVVDVEVIAGCTLSLWVLRVESRDREQIKFDALSWAATSAQLAGPRAICSSSMLLRPRSWSWRLNYVCKRRRRAVILAVDANSSLVGSAASFT